MMALAVLLQDSAVARAEELGPFALLFMLVSMAAVTALTVWCFSRVLGGKRHFDPDGTGPARPPVPGRVEEVPPPE